ncbi:MAG: hypothetical protein ACRD1C_07340 [Terriglobales bacterium]
MSTQPTTLPEINRRLLEQRGAFVDTAAALRSRLLRGARNLTPVRQLQRHPEAGMAVALVLGLIVGRILGGLAGILLR